MTFRSVFDGVFRPAFGPAFGEGGAVFSPDDIADLLMWYDPSDASTLTLEDTNRVAQLDDKAGSNNLTAAGTARPTTGTQTIGSLNALAFDGTANVLQNLAVATVSDSFDFFLVFNATGINNASDSCFSCDNNAGNDFQVEATSGTQFFAGFGENGMTVGAIQSTADLTGIDVLVNYRLDATANTCVLRVNAAADANTTYVGTLNNSQEVRFGTNRGVAQFLGMEMAEFLWYDRALLTAETTQVENYLTSKWGL